MISRGKARQHGVVPAYHEPTLWLASLTRQHDTPPHLSLGITKTRASKLCVFLLLPKPPITLGDTIPGLPSNGLRSNGFSLARKIIARAGLSYTDQCPWSASAPLGAALLAPTTIYVRALLPAIRASVLKGLAHITGGGFVENVPRVLPKGAGARIDAGSYPYPEVFRWLGKPGARNLL
ncbi:phosphoribosylamine-glycine ligase/phosphoribosylformylglycinamidine cyclo-ligase [Ceratobasidium sp. AG-Ba]|nr:phosphoribosylamine-glycine ligase/phosphoribosylformylglycinamidine cyclo-ligase [Ceratobasidium sp. AG-Ba]QRW11942.1 phosphoribosylamine-glycine ligase/phosphoribosylformylglycinamidine cyclo-ligase [Ceratobasidium sp. AG-Ba]